MKIEFYNDWKLLKRASFNHIAAIGLEHFQILSHNEIRFTLIGFGFGIIWDTKK